jgi:hypothetical protein
LAASIGSLPAEPCQTQKHHYPHHKTAKVFYFPGAVIQHRPAPIGGHPHRAEDDYVSTKVEESVKQVRSYGQAIAGERGNRTTQDRHCSHQQAEQS